MMHRRELLGTLAAGAALSAMGDVSAGSENASGSASRLGLVIYVQTLRRRFLKKSNPQDDLGQPIRFLEHAHQLGAGGIQLPLGIGDAKEMQTLRTRAEQLGMFVEAIIGPPRAENDVERFEAEIRRAATANVSAVRTVIIPGRRYEFFDSLEMFNEALAKGKRVLELAAPVVERHRVRLAVENHKDQRIDDRVQLLQQISSEYVGACVDTGNNIALLDDPIEVIQKLAPWAFSVHLKDQGVQEYEDGFLLADVPLGEGCLDLKKMVEILREAKPNVNFSLELITRDALKVPCLGDKYWATFPDLPGRNLARTLRMVRQNASATLPQVSSLPMEDQVELEAQQVAASLAYARRELGLASS